MTVAATNSGTNDRARQDERAVDVPRLPYAMVMVGACATAIGAAWMLASQSPERGYAAGVVAVAALTTFVPVLMYTKPTNFGLVVFGTSIARNLLVMGLMLAVIMLVEGIERRPLLIGILAGTAMILIVETMLAIGILGWLDRKKAFSASAFAAEKKSSGGVGSVD